MVMLALDTTTEENVVKVKKIMGNRRIGIREVAEDGISAGLCNGIVSELLGTKPMTAKFIFKWLNEKNKNSPYFLNSVVHE